MTEPQESSFRSQIFVSKEAVKIKNYILADLNIDGFTKLLLCLSHENIFCYHDDVRQELNGSGVLLLDQLLITGDGNNRFVRIPYKNGELQFSMAENASVSSVVRQNSEDLLRQHPSCIRYSILTDAQKEKLMA